MLGGWAGTALGIDYRIIFSCTVSKVCGLQYYYYLMDQKFYIPLMEYTE